MINTCQVVASINEDIGGPAYSVTNLAKTLLDQQITSYLFALNYKRHGPQVPSEGVHLYSPVATSTACHLRGFQPSAKVILNNLVETKSIDLVHNHGLWMFQNLYARQVAERNNIPLIISPRGTLESWSLNNGRYKKKFAWMLYERQNLSRATVFHATSQSELQSIRQLGFQQPVTLIPNGVHLPDLGAVPERSILEERFPELKEKSWLLFLSRIHPKKGLNILLNTWKELSAKYPNWHLIIAGPDLTGYQAELEKIVKNFDLTQSITFTGMLSGDYKAAAFSNSELFVLPTYSENFGIAIAEALSYGVPAITTKGAPWKELEENQCGWWVESDELILEKTLEKAILLSAKERENMGVRGRKLIEEKYSWNSIGTQMEKTYRWILNAGSQPEFVYT